MTGDGHQPPLRSYRLHFCMVRSLRARFGGYLRAGLYVYEMNYRKQTEGLCECLLVQEKHRKEQGV